MAKNELLLHELEENKKLKLKYYSFQGHCPRDELVQTVCKFIIDNKLKLDGLMLADGNISSHSLPWLSKLKKHVRCLDVSNNHLGSDAVTKLKKLGFEELRIEENTLEELQNPNSESDTSSLSSKKQTPNIFNKICNWPKLFFCQTNRSYIPKQPIARLNIDDDILRDDIDPYKTFD